MGKPGQFQNMKFDAKTWGPCKVEYYKGKSYIRQVLPNGKLSSVIGHTASFHQDVCSKLIPHVKEGKTKEELLKIRYDIVNHQGIDVG